jgi:predicted transglutaminase-like cysteine proteinase
MSKDYSKLELSKGLASRKDVQEHLAKMTRLETIIYWIFDWKTRKSSNLKTWVTQVLKYSELTPIISELEDKYPKFNSYPNISKVNYALQYVKNKIKYTPDIDSWEVLDKWQTPNETWDLKTGDCEDGALLLYLILSNSGIPDSQLRIVCGDVKAGGHAYLVWRSDENGLEYPLDWCYWYDISVKLSTPYSSRDDYYYGEKEWFSFNKSGVYKKR